MTRRHQGFPEGEERRALSASGRAEAAKLRAGGPEGMQDEYRWLDSSLDAFQPWTPYAETFRHLIPEKKLPLRVWLEEELSRVKGPRIFVDLGGVGSQIAADFTPGFFESSYGITLVDHRRTKGREEKYKAETAEDAARRHTVIEADLLEDATYDFLEEQLGGNLLTLVIERMAKGLKNIPIDPYAVAQKIDRVYGLMAEGGVLLLQVPNGFDTLLPAWVKYLRHVAGDSLEVRYHLGEGDESTARGASSLYLKKKAGAPAALPFLDPRTVKEIGQEGYDSGYRGDA